jgi:hypothetical protein
MRCLQGIEFDEERAALEEQIGAPKGPPGQWSSCVRLIDPKSLQTTRWAVLPPSSLHVCSCGRSMVFTKLCAEDKAGCVGSAYDWKVLGVENRLWCSEKQDWKPQQSCDIPK